MKVSVSSDGGEQWKTKKPPILRELQGLFEARFGRSGAYVIIKAVRPQLVNKGLKWSEGLELVSCMPTCKVTAVMLWPLHRLVCIL